MWQVDLEDAVAELCVHLVLLDALRQAHPAFEAAVEAFGISASFISIFRAPLSANDQHAVVERELDIVFRHARNLCGHKQFVVLALDFDVRPAWRRSEAWQPERAEGLVEQPVDIAS